MSQLPSGPIAPEQAPSRLPGAVGEHAVVRDREAREAHVVRADLLGERNRLARHLERLRVEGLGDERPVAHEEQVTGRRVLHERLRRREHLLLVRIDRSDPVRAVLRLLAGHEVEEVLAVGKKLRPPDRGLLARRVELDGDRPGSPRRGHAIDGIGARAVEEDHAVGAPGAVGAAGRVADLGRRAAGDVHLLHHAVGDEPDVPAVGRPERPNASVRSRQRLRRQRVERPHPDARLALHVGRVEGEQCARRERCAARPSSRSREAARCRTARPARASARGARTRRERRGGDAAPPPAGPRRASRGSCGARRPARARPPCEPPSAIHCSCSITSCAVDQRCSGSLARQPLTMRSSEAGIIGWIDEIGGGSEFMIEPIRLAWLLPGERLLPGHHLVEHAAEREDVGARVGLAALELLGRHVLERAEDRAARRQRLALLERRRQARGLRHLGSCPAPTSFARPKSSSFTPDFVSMTLPGFRSRWTIPLPVRGVERVGDLDRDLAAPGRSAARPWPADPPASRPRETP